MTLGAATVTAAAETVQNPVEWIVLFFLATLEYVDIRCVLSCLLTFTYGPTDEPTDEPTDTVITNICLKMRSLYACLAGTSSIFTLQV